MTWKLLLFVGLGLLCATACHAWIPQLQKHTRSACSCSTAVANSQLNNTKPIDLSATAAAAVTGVTLKIALDTAGGVACQNAKPERFTAAESLDMVHRLRAAADAVLIGVGTALADNPSLLVRRGVTVRDQQPLRVILDPTLRMLAENVRTTYQLMTDGYPVVIYHVQKDVDQNLVDKGSSVQLVYLEPLANGKLSVAQIVADLSRRFAVQHLMVEGGPVTARAFLEADRVDRCILVKAPVTFQKPLLSGITDAVLQKSMVRLGVIESGVDSIECWSRPNLSWPATELRDWP